MGQGQRPCGVKGRSPFPPEALCHNVFSVNATSAAGACGAVIEHYSVYQQQKTGEAEICLSFVIVFDDCMAIVYPSSFCCINGRKILALKSGIAVLFAPVCRVGGCAYARNCHAPKLYCRHSQSICLRRCAPPSIRVCITAPPSPSRAPPRGASRTAQAHGDNHSCRG